MKIVQGISPLGSASLPAYSTNPATSLREVPGPAAVEE